MLLVFSDIDGTLLDPGTGSPGGALPGLEFLRERGIPLALVSSKTFGEMTPLHRELRLDAPFAFENGAGVAYPEGTAGEGPAFRVELAGKGIAELRRAIPLVEEVIGEPVVTLTEMPIRRLMEYTGLTRRGALLAKKRRASLPFITARGERIPDERRKALAAVLASVGLEIVWGGRFYHLVAPGAGKDDAVRRITGFYLERFGEAPFTVGVGDSENDLPMLKAVDRPFLVRNPRARLDYGSVGIEVTGFCGGEGFTEAVLRACGGEGRAIPRS